ncbi:MAG: hypothetical protein ACRD4C_03350 [Candidatus Acidiferrales bacterium]
MGPLVGRFGLLVLELHTLPPELTAANLEKTPPLAYDGTHGFSDQYLVELPIFWIVHGKLGWKRTRVFRLNSLHRNWRRSA